MTFLTIFTVDIFIVLIIFSFFLFFGNQNKKIVMICSIVAFILWQVISIYVITNMHEENICTELTIKIIYLILIMYLIFINIIYDKIIIRKVKKIDNNDNLKIKYACEYTFLHANKLSLKNEFEILKEYIIKKLDFTPIDITNLLVSNIVNTTNSKNGDIIELDIYARGIYQEKKGVYKIKGQFLKKKNVFLTSCPNCGSPNVDDEYCKYCDTKLYNEERNIILYDIISIEKYPTIYIKVVEFIKKTLKYIIKNWRRLFIYCGLLPVILLFEASFIGIYRIFSIIISLLFLIIIRKKIIKSYYLENIKKNYRIINIIVAIIHVLCWYFLSIFTFVIIAVITVLWYIPWFIIPVLKFYGFIKK